MVTTRNVVILNVFCWAGLTQAVELDKSKVELVLARYNEGVSWATEYFPITTIYNKGDEDLPADATSISLPNQGRESQTYLAHIVNKWDKLAEWTVFSQAEEPSYGYNGHRLGGGHLLPGVKFEDYLTPDADGIKMWFTGTQSLDQNHLSLHRLRRSFQDRPEESSSGRMCPTNEGWRDAWGPWWELPQWFKDSVATYQTEQHADISGFNPKAFFDKYIRVDLNADMDRAYFAQGARFAVSRDLIRSRPKKYYETLLSLLQHEDSWAGYYMEWFWWYVFSADTHPCGNDEDALDAATFMWQDALGRRMQGASGVSGISATTVTTTGAYPATTTPFVKKTLAQITAEVTAMVTAKLNAANAATKAAIANLDVAATANRLKAFTPAALAAKFVATALVAANASAELKAAAAALAAAFKSVTVDLSAAKVSNAGGVVETSFKTDKTALQMQADPNCALMMIMLVLDQTMETAMTTQKVSNAVFSAVAAAAGRRQLAASNEVAMKLSAKNEAEMKTVVSSEIQKEVAKAVEAQNKLEAAVLAANAAAAAKIFTQKELLVALAGMTVGGVASDGIVANAMGGVTLSYWKTETAIITQAKFKVGNPAPYGSLIQWNTAAGAAAALKLGTTTSKLSVSSTYGSLKTSVGNAVVASDSGLSGGAIAGIVIGVLVGVALIAAGVFFILKKK